MYEMTEPRNTHLDLLRLFNYLAAAFYVVIGVTLVPLCVAVVEITGSVPSGDVPVLYGALATGTLMCFFFAVMAWAMASRVAEGRWRWLQTVWAVLNLSNNPPFGAAYGLYALWVCWINPETKAAFERA
jgi:hypothetical protein